MGVHHVALATNDVAATDRFYTDVMGFDLAKVEAVPTESGGWARHLFYDTHGSGMLAIWDIHDEPKVPDGFDPSISRGLGLPAWTNHLAFDAGSLDGLATHRDRWLAAGLDVAEMDHGWCTSIYLTDPNGILVEFCATTATFTDEDRTRARRLLAEERPAVQPEGAITIHEAARR